MTLRLMVRAGQIRAFALPGGTNVRSTTTQTTLDVIAATIKDVLVERGVPPLVVVDYLQEVCTPNHLAEEDRVTRITEGLKDLSIEFECPVVAISASDRGGLRMRPRNMRGSTALAYEADVVLTLARSSSASNSTASPAVAS